MSEILLVLRSILNMGFTVGGNVYTLGGIAIVAAIIKIAIGIYDKMVQRSDRIVAADWQDEGIAINDYLTSSEFEEYFEERGSKIKSSMSDNEMADLISGWEEY